MFTKSFIQSCFLEILKECGNPPITLVSKKKINHKCPKGRKLLGSSNWSDKEIWINKNQPNELELKDTIWHEILHCAFVRMPEWWIELCGHKMAYNTSTCFLGESLDKNKRLKDVPSRKEILKMIRAISDI
jgi:hypothetical protein